MISDILTVMWKEGKEIMAYLSGRSKLSPLIFVSVFGLFLPFQMGKIWVESPMVLVYSGWAALFLVNSIIADSFAGERERYTLETLLASRLSDRSILFGKILVAVVYGCGMTWLSLLIALVPVNLMHGQGGLLLYPLTVGSGIVGFSLAGAGLAASAGVLISLRAATVRQAQQTLSITTMLLLFVPVFGVQALPYGWKARIVEALTAVDATRVVIAAIGLLVLLDIGLLAIAMARFKRSRLISD
ncbi:MAG: ABC transporter permease [Spirochaetes bacterium]|nr:ABC transporter permease [Spirochaetota bacterium]